MGTDIGIVKLAQRVAHERLTRICFNDYDREIAIGFAVNYDNFMDDMKAEITL